MKLHWIWDKEKDEEEGGGSGNHEWEKLHIYQLMNFIYQKKSLERIPQFVYQMSVGVNLIRDRPLTFSNSAF